MKKNLIVLGIASIVVVVILAIYFFIPEAINVSPVEHEVIVYYEDGTTSEIEPLGVTYVGKRIDEIGYTVVPNGCDISNYNPYFQTPFGPVQIDNEQKVDVYQLVNFTLDDGDYTITLIPEGTITKNGEQVPLPPKIDFVLTIEDNRALDISFG